MTFLTTKPDPGPSPTLDASKIQTNFSQYGTIFATNHKGMNSSDAGNHTSVIMEKQATDPVVDENMAVVYSKDTNSVAGTQPQLFVRIPQFLPNDMPNDPMQLTYNTVNTAGPVYQSFLPGGYLLFFGMTNNIAVPITLSPVPSELLIAIATPNILSGANILKVSTDIISASSFQIYSTGGLPADPYSFIAIGRV